MLIAVNTRFLLSNKLEGIGRFTFETLSRITRKYPEHRFLFFFDRPHSPEFIFGDNVIPVNLFPPARHPFLYMWWFEWSVARALRKYKPDVFLSTDGFLSLNTKVPSVPVIHDLAFIHYPQGIDRITLKYYHFFFPKFARKATQIVAVSNYTKQDIVKQYHIEPQKIDVVYNAPAKGFVPLADDEKTKVKQQYTNGHNYFVYVGALHPRKNIGTLLKAFDAFKQQTTSDIKLVIVGRKAWLTKEIEAAYEQMQHKHEVIFTGRVPEEDLYRITAAAHCMVYIPLFEGFGLPLVEAMACDVPAITSNVSSMPEVSGDAALLIDPLSVEQVKDAMIKITTDKALFQKLTLAAQKRKHAFSWDNSAEQLWQTLLKASHKN